MHTRACDPGASPQFRAHPRRPSVRVQTVETPPTSSAGRCRAADPAPHPAHDAAACPEASCHRPGAVAKWRTSRRRGVAHLHSGFGQRARGQVQVSKGFELRDSPEVQVAARPKRRASRQLQMHTRPERRAFDHLHLAHGLERRAFSCLYLAHGLERRALDGGSTFEASFKGCTRERGPSRRIHPTNAGASGNATCPAGASNRLRGRAPTHSPANARVSPTLPNLRPRFW